MAGQVRRLLVKLTNGGRFKGDKKAKVIDLADGGSGKKGRPAGIGESINLVY